MLNLVGYIELATTGNEITRKRYGNASEKLDLDDKNSPVVVQASVIEVPASELFASGSVRARVLFRFRQGCEVEMDRQRRH